MVILLPSLLPVANQLGIDSIHYTIVSPPRCGIGLFLPPVGVGLFIACGIAGISVDSTSASTPYLAALVVGLMILILFPEITLFLPRRAGMGR